MHHDLKIWPTYFESVVSGTKTFEIRKNDRNFRAGDTVTLHEYVPDGKEYTGRSYSAKIGYVTAFEQKPGYVVFSLIEQEDE